MSIDVRVGMKVKNRDELALKSYFVFFKEAGIELIFLHHRLPEYDRKRGNFEAGSSIIDVLMFNSKEEISALLG